MNNYIIGIMGKKGSGKSNLIKKYMLKNMVRYIIIDTLYEYEDDRIFYNIDELYDYLKENKDRAFKIIFRPENDNDIEILFQISKTINNYTLVIEEVDFYADTFHINENLLYNIKYGRHFGRNIIWVSRSPYEINRFLTRQTDLLIVFKQTEPRDIEYLNKYKFDKNIQLLGKYEYAISGDLNVFPFSKR